LWHDVNRVASLYLEQVVPFVLLSRILQPA
jgi:hypothetical protein